MRWTLAAVATLALAVAGTVGSPTQVGPAAASDTGRIDVRVASFNVQSVSVDRTVGARRPWRQRRGAVIAEILGERVDVVGVQEVNPSRHWAPRLVDGRNQYLDLRNGLNKAGGHYRLTNAHAYNCVNARTSYRCVHRYRGASHSDRILYDADTVELVRQGAKRYTRQSGTSNPRYLAWAVLRMRATGSEFLFASTHLEPRNVGVRAAQWRQLIAELTRRAGGLPVVSVGDFNTQKYDALAGTMLPAMRDAGFGDVLNQQYAINPVRVPRARSTVNGWVNTCNHDRRDVASFGYEDSRSKTGNGIDWIFASNALPVQEWKVVLDFDPQTLEVRGTLPSDHNMVRATITLP